MSFAKVLSIGFLLLISRQLFAQNANHSDISNVFLYGSVKNFANQIEVEDISELSEFVASNTIGLIVPDSNNFFKFSFHLEKANYFRIGRNILYLSPGDKMKVYLDSQRPDYATFAGKGNEANNYLRFTPLPFAGSFLNGGDLIRPSFLETYHLILDSAKRRTEILQKLTKIGLEFRHLEQIRIQADIINSLLYWQDRLAYDNHIKDEDSLKTFAAESDSCLKLRYKMITLHDSFLKITVYRYIVPKLVANCASNLASINAINDYLKARETANKLLRFTRREEMLAYDTAIAATTNARYNNWLRQLSTDLVKFGNGDVAKDFTFLNIGDKSISLSRYNGKVIYLDIWATWCGPCMSEMPFLDTLMTNYLHYSEIVFLSLSIDVDKQKWKDNLSKRKPKGEQGIIGGSQLRDYKLLTIPRTVIIDKNFKIIELYGPSPSFKGTSQILDSLITKRTDLFTLKVRQSSK